MDDADVVSGVEELLRYLSLSVGIEPLGYEHVMKFYMLPQKNNY